MSAVALRLTCPSCGYVAGSYRELTTHQSRSNCLYAVINDSGDESISGQPETTVSSPMDMDTDMEYPSAVDDNGTLLDK